MPVDRQRLTGWVVLAVSVLAVIVTTGSGIHNYQRAQCQAQVNEALIEASNARAAAATADRDSDRAESAATAELIRTVFTAATTPERLAAYDKYRAALDDIGKRRAAAEADRAQHPLPAPPSQVCR